MYVCMYVCIVFHFRLTWLGLDSRGRLKFGLREKSPATLSHERSEAVPVVPKETHHWAEPTHAHHWVCLWKSRFEKGNATQQQLGERTEKV